MGSFSIWHWLIVLVIVAMVFGTKKLRNMGEDLGGAVKGFKQGMKDSEESTTPPQKLSGSDSNVVDTEVREKKNV